MANARVTQAGALAELSTDGGLYVSQFGVLVEVEDAALEITPDSIASASAIYAPQLDLSVEPDSIGSTDAVYAPSLLLHIEPDTIASAEVVYGPTLDLNIILDAIGSTATVYAPSLILNITPDHIGSTAAVYDPTVLHAPSARVTQAGVLVEIHPDAVVYVSQAGALVEVSEDQEVFLTQAGVLVEIALTIQTGIVPTLEHAAVYYGGINITSHLSGAVLNALIIAVDTTNFDSTDAAEKTAGPSRWKADVTGLWSPTLDDIFSPDVVTPPAQDELRTFQIVLGWPGNTVTYAWTDAAFVLRYAIEADVDSILNWSGVLALSGSPTRTATV